MKLPFKNFYNYALDFLLLYGFIGITISSYALWFVLPMATGLAAKEGSIRGMRYCQMALTGEGSQGNSIHYLGSPRFEWVEIHSWIAIITAGLVIIHLILHWRWIIDTTRRVKDYFLKGQKAILERYIAGFTLFILTGIQVLSGFVLWIILPRGVGDSIPSRFGDGRTFWGLQRNEWLDLHAWVAVFMVAIIVIHVIIHWQWIVNMTIGKLKARKAKGTMEGIIHQVDKPKIEPGQPAYLPRVGTLIGLVGAICFLVAMLTFQLDWVGKYGFMLYLIPIPFIGLTLARKWPFISGAFLIIIGISAIVFFLVFPIGIMWNKVGVWNELGLETIYTVVFVTLPLVASGSLFLLSESLRKRRI
jgi:hypothetical protein